jgi:hypothetical protein
MGSTRTASSTISKTAKSWRWRAAAMVVEQEEVDLVVELQLWLEARLITSRWHVLRRRK